MSFRPSIKTAVAAGNTVIDTVDWPVSYTDALLSGETIAIEHTDNTTVEYTIASNYSSDTNGEILSITVSPALTYDAIAGDPVQTPNRRKLSSAMRTAIAAENSTIAHFMEFQFSGGSVLLNTSIHNMKMMNPDLGTPAVNGGSQTGSSLVTDGWTPSAKAFRHGDTFFVSGVEYTCDIASTTVGVDNCESGWQEFNRTKTEVVLSHVSSPAVSGNSVKMVVSTSVKKNRLIGYRDLDTAQDISPYESVQFSVRSSVALNSGDFMLVFSTKKVCKNSIEYIPFPDLEADTWTTVDTEFYNPDVLTNIKSVGVMVMSNLTENTTIFVDRIRVYTKLVDSDASGNATIPVTPAISPSPANDTLLLRTWTGFGGNLYFEQVDETSDLKANGTTVVLSGVDQSIIQIILAQHYVGREAKLYRAHFDGGNIISEPLFLFWGYMNGGFKVKETKGEDVEDTDKSVEISADIQDEISVLDIARGIQTNPSSLQSIFPDDGGFDSIADLAEAAISWGKFDKPSGGGMCVLATACLRHKGLPDDCEELKILRDFRDTHLAKTAEGKKIIEEYYSIVNMLVREIEECRTDMYEKIYEDIRQAVTYIKAGDFTKATQKYYDIINPLKEEFI